LRTAEFLWQEGHTVHATEQDAREETMKMLEVYREFAENVLALPVIAGEKTEGERFPGAVNTYCIEAMMQDRKALQAGTSHYLGQNFARGSDIKFVNEAGEIQFAYTTSWGVSTRLIGGMIMTHGDDDGLRVPPKVAPKHAVILPICPKPELQGQIFEYCDRIAAALRPLQYSGRELSVHIDKRDQRGGEKNWQWIKKGIPLRIEAGPRDMEAGKVVVYRRDKPHKEKIVLSLAELPEKILPLLDEMQANYLAEARVFRDANIVTDLKNFEDFKAFFTPKNAEKPEIHGGFVRAKWCGDAKVEESLKEMKVTIRCLPLDQSGTSGACIVTGRPAIQDAIFAKAY
jgi:prolyl-tRNA synthetase